MSGLRSKPRMAVHKFTSCDGCQLAFLNLGETLLELTEQVDLIHFAEAGAIGADEEVDIAFVEGSISTPDEQQRIVAIRRNSRYLITIGACATAGGLQALRNRNDTDQWLADIYAQPEHISTLDQATAIADHVSVDLELWGCPVNGRQVLAAVKALLAGMAPVIEQDKVCQECKRQQLVCVMVSRGLPCMGPVTRTGCGAICPAFGRDCYACYGPAENCNTTAMAQCLGNTGLAKQAVQRRFRFINNAAPLFALAAEQLDESSDD